MINLQDISSFNQLLPIIQHSEPRVTWYGKTLLVYAGEEYSFNPNYEAFCRCIMTIARREDALFLGRNVDLAMRQLKTKHLTKISENPISLIIYCFKKLLELIKKIINKILPYTQITVAPDRWIQEREERRVSRGLIQIDYQKWGYENGLIREEIARQTFVRPEDLNAFDEEGQRQMIPNQYQRPLAAHPMEELV